MNSLTLSKRTMVVALLAAFGLALMLAASMASPAYAATKKPYAGYTQATPSYYYVYNADHSDYTTMPYVRQSGAGEISMTNIGDTRKVKAGLLDDENSFTVWSGDFYWAPLSNFNNNDTDDSGNYTNDHYTWVTNTSQFKKIKGMTYNKKKNTLTLKNVKAPQYVLNVDGMGTGFKIVLKGKKNQLAGIKINAKQKVSVVPVTDSDGDMTFATNTTGYYPSCVKIDGKGKLVINKKKYNTSSPIWIDGGGSYSNWNYTTQKHEYGSAYTKSKLTVTKKPTVQLYASATNDLVTAYNSAAKKPVSFAGVKSSALTAASQKYAAITEANEYSSVYSLTPDASGYYVDANGTKYISSGYVGSGISLNNGAYYGVPDESAGWYFDTKTRSSFYSKWKIYQKVSVSYGDTFDPYDTYDYYGVYVATVGNSKALPKGYTADDAVSYKAHYSYAVKNSKLTAGNI